MVVPVPMGPWSLVLILRGFCSICRGSVSWVQWSMKFAVAPESVKAGRTKIFPFDRVFDLIILGKLLD